MKTVIYNPNSIDSILTAAVLQTNGWTANSLSDLLVSGSEIYLWLDVMPTTRHFRDKIVPPSVGRFDKLKAAVSKVPKEDRNTDPINRHVAFLKGGQIRNNHPAIIKNVQFADQILSNTTRDLVITTRSSVTLMQQVESMQQAVPMQTLASGECHLLNYLISNFYKPSSVEMLAITCLNVVKALECLKNRELFTPVPLPEQGKNTEELHNAMELYGKMVKDATRILNYGAVFDHTRSSADHTRVIRTYLQENWWLVRKFFQKGDIGFNINVSGTGVHVDATLKYEFDLGVQDPVYVIS